MVYERPMTPEFIEEIETALRYHSNYGGTYRRGKYLRMMDRLAAFEPTGKKGFNAPALKISHLLDRYFKAVGVTCFDEALERLRKLDEKEKA